MFLLDDNIDKFFSTDKFQTYWLVFKTEIIDVEHMTDLKHNDPNECKSNYDILLFDNDYTNFLYSSIE